MRKDPKFNQQLIIMKAKLYTSPGETVLQPQRHQRQLTQPFTVILTQSGEYNRKQNFYDFKRQKEKAKIAEKERLKTAISMDWRIRKSLVQVCRL